MKKKHFFSLLEVLIALAILSFCMSVVGIGIHHSIVQQRFLSEVKRVADQLQLAQDLVLITGDDVRIIFTKEEDGLYRYKLRCENSAGYKKWEEMHNRLQAPLSTIKSIRFNKKTLDEAKRIDIIFLPAGRKVESGELVLSEDPQEGKVKIIKITDYLRPISASSAREEENYDEMVKKESEEIYPYEGIKLLNTKQGKNG